MVSNCNSVGLRSRDLLDENLLDSVVDLGLYELEDSGATGVVVDSLPCGCLDLFGFTV